MADFIVSIFSSRVLMMSVACRVRRAWGGRMDIGLDWKGREGKGRGGEGRVLLWLVRLWWGWGGGAWRY